MVCEMAASDDAERAACKNITPELVDLGASGCNAGAGSPCSNACEGDCDSDDDCAGALTCFQRDSPGLFGSRTLVPGCAAGGAGDISDFDYCYDPSIVLLVDLGSSGCSSSSPCANACEGDCDSDSDCGAGMTCFQRDSSSELVPGCAAGGVGDVSDHDYCYL